MVLAAADCHRESGDQAVIIVRKPSPYIELVGNVSGVQFKKYIVEYTHVVVLAGLS